jgi:predicted RecA/RadA family phage recombinase
MDLQIRSPASQIKTTQFSHSAATSAHAPVLVNSKVFIPTDDADANALNGFVYDAEISDAAKDPATAFSPGTKVYWDNTNQRFTATATSNTLCGYALEAMGASDATTGLIAFNSNAA